MASESPTDWRRQAFTEYVERRDAKLGEIAAAREKAEKYSAIAKAREAELADLDKAAKVLGIVVEPENSEGFFQEESDLSDAPDVPGFKEIAIEALKRAFPGSLRANAIQHIAERQTLRTFHAKTAGMTLYRLSQDGIARREGWDWYFVPENERQPRHRGLAAEPAGFSVSVEATQVEVK